MEDLNYHIKSLNVNIQDNHLSRKSVKGFIESIY